MSDALKRIADDLGWTPQETIEKLDEWWKEASPEEYAHHKGDFSSIKDEGLVEYILSGFEATWRRRASSSSGSGQTYHGMIVGYNGRNDLMSRQREKALESINLHGIDYVLKNGIQPYTDDRVVKIGRGAFFENAWRVYDDKDREIHTEEGAESDLPEWAIAVPGQRYFIALIGVKGPKRAYSYKTEWLVLVNTKEGFLKGGFDKPIILECSWDAADVRLQMNRPITFQAEEDKSWFDDSVRILKTSNLTPIYGLDWLPEEKKTEAEPIFSPPQIFMQFMPFVPDLDLVHDYHDDNKTTLESGRDVGPTFAIRGSVDYMDFKGREENIYGLSADGGAQHRMSLFTQALRRDDRDAAVYLSVSRTLIDHHHAFEAKISDEWCDYTKGTQVFAVVKTRTWTNNTTGEAMLDCDVLNIYAIPGRSQLAEQVSSDGNNLGSLGGFRSE